MKVQERRIETMDEDPSSRQELDRDFLSSGYQRLVFVSTDPEHAWRRAPRRSRAPLTLVPVPVDGESRGRLVYEDGEGRVQSIEMRPGRYYFVPPQVPYQIETRGRGILEVYSPRSPRLLDEEVLAADYFEPPGAGGGAARPEEA